MWSKIFKACSDLKDRELSLVSGAKFVFKNIAVYCNWCQRGSLLTVNLSQCQLFITTGQTAPKEGGSLFLLWSHVGVKINFSSYLPTNSLQIVSASRVLVRSESEQKPSHFSKWACAGRLKLCCFSPSVRWLQIRFYISTAINCRGLIIYFASSEALLHSRAG